MKSVHIVALILVASLVGLQSAVAGRYYDARIARFTTPDPILREKLTADLVKLHGGLLLGTSPYSYELSNPLRFVDPDGKNPIIFFFAALAVMALNPETANAPGPHDPTYSAKQGPLAAMSFVADATMVSSAMKGLSASLAIMTKGRATGEVVTTIVSGAGKAEAKRIVASQADEMGEKQLSGVLDQIRKATTTESVTVEKLSDGSIRVLKERAGNDGKQVIESIVNSSGQKNIVQRAYDAAGKLVHNDPKRIEISK